MKTDVPRLVCAARIFPGPGWNLAGQFHSSHEITIVAGGRLRVETALGGGVAGSGDVLFYRAGDLPGAAPTGCGCGKGGCT